MELKPARLVPAVEPVGEPVAFNASSHSAAPSPPTPSLHSLREMPSMNALPGSESDGHDQGTASARPKPSPTIYNWLKTHLDRQTTRSLAYMCLGTLAMAVVARLGPAITKGSTSGCDADLVAFMKSLSLEKLAPDICSKGFTRLADVLHLSAEMLRDEIGISSPAHRHRILYTSAELLSNAQMNRQAMASASASAAHAWGPVAVLCVAVPLAAMCGVFLMTAVALSVPEIRHKLVVLLAVGASELGYWFSQRRHTDPDGGQKVKPPRNSALPGGDGAGGGGTEAFVTPTDAGAESSSAYAASSSSRGSSRSRHRSGRSGRRPNNNSSSADAAAPSTPDNSGSRRHAPPPMTVISTGGRISSGGRAARRAGSAAAAAFAALSPRGRHRADPLPVSGDSAIPDGHGISHHSALAAPGGPGPLPGVLPEHTAGEAVRAGGAGLELPVSRPPAVSASRLPEPHTRLDGAPGRASALLPLQEPHAPRLSPPAVPADSPCGPVGEAAAVSALNSGLVRQARHVFGGRTTERTGPAAVGGNTSSSSAESIGDVAGPSTRLAPVAAGRGQAAAPELQGVGEIDLALSVVSVDSVKTDCGSHDGATVSLSTWNNGASLSAHALAGGRDSAAGEDGAALLGSGEGARAMTEPLGTLRQGKRWRSAVRRLQRGNTRMLQLLRSRVQE